MLIMCHICFKTFSIYCLLNHHKNKREEKVNKAGMDVLINLMRESFPNVYVYQIITFLGLLYPSKAGKKKICTYISKALMFLKIRQKVLRVPGPIHFSNFISHHSLPLSRHTPISFIECQHSRHRISLSSLCLSYFFTSPLNQQRLEFHDCSVVRTPCFHCRGHSSITAQGLRCPKWHGVAKK